MKERKKWNNHVNQCKKCFASAKAGSGDLLQYCRRGRRLFNNIPLAEIQQAAGLKQQSN